MTVPFKIQSLIQLYLYLVKNMEEPPAYIGSESSSSDNNVRLKLKFNSSTFGD